MLFFLLFFCFVKFYCAVCFGVTRVERVVGRGGKGCLLVGWFLLLFSLHCLGLCLVMCGGVYLCDFSCEKQSRCTVTKSNGTFDNVCGPKVRGEQFLMIYYCTRSKGGSRGVPLSKI